MKQHFEWQRDNTVFFVEEERHRNVVNYENEESQPDISFPGNMDPYVTSFVCLLVPRFEEHLLVGDVTDLLYSWMKDICISFGWQLKFIDVNPRYLHWIMTVSITSVPTQFMKIVRLRTSKMIFDEFPRFKKRNMSNEFWAPWYFVGVGDVSYSKDTIRSFINQIRSEQGLQ